MNIESIPKACLALACACFFAGCATEPSLYTGETSYYAYSWEQEQEIGQKNDAQIVSQMGLYPNDELAEYVRGVGQQVLEKSALRSPDAPALYEDTDFTFRLMDSPVVNAFALPGGYVYVTRGLLAHVENEAQLAVIIGHEITHVEARHASQQALNQRWGQIGLLAGAIIGEQVAENKELARQVVDVSGTLFQLATLKYGRDAERESDLHGVEYAAKAGYAAAQGSAFFESLERMSEKSGQSLPSWMSSHPDPGEREQTIQELAAKWGDTQQMEIVGRERYLEKIDGLIVGENPRNGYTENNRFLHPELEFQFDVPAGWQVQNESGAVYVVEGGGDAVLTFSLASEDTLVAAAQAAQQHLQLQPTFAQEDNVHSLPAYIMEGVVQTQTGAMPVYSTFINYQDRVFRFLGYGAPETFAIHKDSIRRVASSFQKLDDPSALNVQPHRITIEPAERAAPFQELLPDALPPGTDAIDWAIMNQVALDETIEAGRLLKLPADR